MARAKRNDNTFLLPMTYNERMALDSLAKKHNLTRSDVLRRLLVQAAKTEGLFFDPTQIPAQ